MALGGDGEAIDTEAGDPLEAFGKNVQGGPGNGGSAEWSCKVTGGAVSVLAAEFGKLIERARNRSRF